MELNRLSRRTSRSRSGVGRDLFSSGATDDWPGCVQLEKADVHKYSPSKADPLPAVGCCLRLLILISCDSFPGDSGPLRCAGCSDSTKELV